MKIPFSMESSFLLNGKKNQNKWNLSLIIFVKKKIVLNISAICSLLFLKLCVEYLGDGRDSKGHQNCFK